MLESLLNQKKEKERKKEKMKSWETRFFHPVAGHALLTDDMQRRVTGSREGTDQREGE